MNTTIKRTAITNQEKENYKQVIKNLTDNFDYYYNLSSKIIPKDEVLSKIRSLLQLIDKNQNRIMTSRDVVCSNPADGGLENPQCGTDYTLGDINNDGNIDVLDVIQMVGFVIQTDTPDANEFCSADIDGNGQIDVLDVVIEVQAILDGNPPVIPCDCIPNTEVQLWGQCYNIEETTDIDL